MAKTIMINIQIDEVNASDLAKIEELLEETLSQYKRKRINYNLTDTFGPPLPVQETTPSI